MNDNGVEIEFEDCKLYFPINGYIIRSCSKGVLKIEIVPKDISDLEPILTNIMEDATTINLEIGKALLFSTSDKCKIKYYIRFYECKEGHRLMINIKTLK